jgi:hypothetical protein
MDNATLLSLRLAREGYWGGDPQRVLEAPTDQVLGAWEFVNFQADLEETTLELNKSTT